MTKRKNEAEIDPNVPRTPEQDRAALRRKVEIFYDIQQLRMQTAGRTFKGPEGKEIQLHEVDVAILERRARELETTERAALRDVEDHLKTLPFYVNTLSDKVRYRGIGPTMAGVILSSFDIAREDTVSKMWAFAGLRPMPAFRCKECHAVVVESALEGAAYFKHVAERPRKSSPGEDGKPALPKCSRAAETIINRNSVYESGKSQRPVKGEKLPYNAWLRSKLCGVLAPVMLKVGSPWKKTYDDYKHRKATAGWGRSDAHRHQAAMRYMIKMLLLDIHKEWRGSLGLPVRPSYHEEKQGHMHSIGGAAPPVENIVEVEEHDGHSAEIQAELEMIANA